VGTASRFTQWRRGQWTPERAASLPANDMMVKRARHAVDRMLELRHLKKTQQVPLTGIQRELGLQARAAPATVSGVPRIVDHWIDEIWEGDAGTISREPGDLLVVVAHSTAGVC
jgi:hypothetical protein